MFRSLFRARREMTALIPPFAKVEILRMDAGWSPEAFEVCRVEGR